LSALGGDNFSDVKRFTETTKWMDPWFTGLSLDAKIAFWYITENCDAAGVWDPNFRMANFAFGRDIDWGSVQAEFKDRVFVLKCGKWVVEKFVEFQYGTLSEECHPHRKVLELLKHHGLTISKGRLRVGKGYPKGTGRGKEEDNKGSEGVEFVVPADIQPIWDEWLAYRSQRHLPAYKEMGIRKQVGQLTKWGAARAREAVDYSIRQNYQGIYEEKQSNGIGAHKKPNDRSYSTVDDYSKLPGMP